MTTETVDVCLDPARSLEAVDNRHLVVHQHEVRLQPAHHFDSFLAIPRLADQIDEWTASSIDRRPSRAIM